MQNYFTLCVSGMFYTCTHICLSPNAAPIVSLALHSVTVVERKSAEIVVMRRGDPGVELSVVLDMEQLAGASNHVQCTFVKKKSSGLFLRYLASVDHDIYMHYRILDRNIKRCAKTINVLAN